MAKNQNINLKQFQSLKTELTRFMMSYKFAIDEMNTKIDILKQEFHYVHDYNPIEHVKTRLKTPESILRKVHRKGINPSFHSIRENIQDIAGVRIICSFISDIYELSRMIQNQKDIKVIKCKDYIKNPKPNGYKSLHLILQIPIFMSDREEDVYIEVQIRTIAMDFWASLEHKIYYKYDKTVPQEMLEELKEAANSVDQLDKKMESIHKKVKRLKEEKEKYEYNENIQELLINDEKFNIPYDFFINYIDVAQ